jgi:hypothetical protein
VVTQTSSFRRSIASRPSGLATADEFRDAARSFSVGSGAKTWGRERFQRAPLGPCSRVPKNSGIPVILGLSPCYGPQGPLHSRNASLPNSDRRNLKCVQVLDLYSTSTIGRERRRGRDLIRHGSPRAQGGYDDNSSRDDARLLGRREHGLSLVRLCLFVGAANSYPLAPPKEIYETTCAVDSR